MTDKPLTQIECNRLNMTIYKWYYVKSFVQICIFVILILSLLYINNNAPNCSSAIKKLCKIDKKNKKDIETIKEIDNLFFQDEDDDIEDRSKQFATYKKKRRRVKQVITLDIILTGSILIMKLLSTFRFYTRESSIMASKPAVNGVVKKYNLSTHKVYYGKSIAQIILFIIVIMLLLGINNASPNCATAVRSACPPPCEVREGFLGLYEDDEVGEILNTYDDILNAYASKANTKKTYIIAGIVLVSFLVLLKAYTLIKFLFELNKDLKECRKGLGKLVRYSAPTQTNINPAMIVPSPVPQMPIR